MGRASVVVAVLLFTRLAEGAIFDVAAGDVAGLIAAITAANANGQDDVINLAPSSTYSLTAVNNGLNGLPFISSRITIAGGSVNGGIDSTITRNPAAVSKFRIFEIGASGDLTLDHVWVTGGRLSGVGNIGGGICVIGGKLTLQSSFVNDCHCDDCSGGGILVTGAASMATLVDSGLSNDSAAVGGAIDVQSAASVTLTRTRIVANLATATTGTAFGGGLSVDAPTTVAIVESTFGGNIVSPMAGSAEGGALCDRGGATWTIERSSIISNDLDVPAGFNGLGGGIHDAGGGTFTIVNTTIAENHVSNAGSGRAEGGGISAGGGGTWTLRNVTIARNAVAMVTPAPLVPRLAPTPLVRGGGVALLDGTMHLKNTIVGEDEATADVSTATAGPDCFTATTPVPMQIVSHGYLLLEDTTDCSVVAGAGDVTGIDPMLGALTVTGGETAVAPLLSGPAIDGGSPAAVGTGGDACEVVDQRCYARPAGARCDIGAFESNAVPSPGCNTAATTSTTTTTMTITPSSTTTTTLPGCANVASYASLGCRLGELVDRVAGASDLGRFRRGLLVLATKARNKTADADAAGGGQQERTALKKAARRMTTLVRRLRSRAVRRIVPAATLSDVQHRAISIRDDLRSLVAALG